MTSRAPTRLVRSAMMRSRRRFARRRRRFRREARTGVGERWAARRPAMPLDGAAELARFRPATASGGDVQAVDRSAVGGQSARYRRVSPPGAPLCYASTRNRRYRRSTARSRLCRCVPVRPPPRLHAARHDLAVRGAGCEGRNHRRQVYASPSGERVSQISRRGRAQCAGGSRRPYRHGQRRHPQDQADPRLVGQAPAPARSLHTKHQLAPRGSIRSSASSPCSPNEPCARRLLPPNGLRIPNLSQALGIELNGLREALLELPYLTRRPAV